MPETCLSPGRIHLVESGACSSSRRSTCNSVKFRICSGKKVSRAVVCSSTSHFNAAVRLLPSTIMYLMTPAGPERHLRTTILSIGRNPRVLIVSRSSATSKFPDFIFSNASLCTRSSANLASGTGSNGSPSSANLGLLGSRSISTKFIDIGERKFGRAIMYPLECLSL